MPATKRWPIGERGRDKIAACGARGMWMGGPVPLGYRVENRKLLVDEAGAATVRRVVEGFAEKVHRGRHPKIRLSPYQMGI